MNVIRLFYIILWGKPNDKYSLQRFDTVLARKKVTQKTKNFYACRKFFMTVVHANVIALYIHYVGLNEIDDFRIWFSPNN